MDGRRLLHIGLEPGRGKLFLPYGLDSTGRVTAVCSWRRLPGPHWTPNVLSEANVRPWVIKQGDFVKAGEQP
jgi:hypothetical protein